MRDNKELLLIALFMFLTLMVYLISVANAGEEYHAKIKPIKQQYCFTKIIITTKGDTVTKEEKLICADGRKNFDEPVIGNCFQNFIIEIQMPLGIVDIMIDRIMLLKRQEKHV